VTGPLVATWSGLAGRRGQRRHRVTVWQHPQAWPGEHCAGVGLGGTRCSGLYRDRASPGAYPPAVWRVTPGQVWCDTDLPARYRALLTGAPVMQPWTGDRRSRRKQRAPAAEQLGFPATPPAQSDPT
jgi:hypothetical protein